MSTLSEDIQRRVPKKTKRSFVSRRLIDELSQDFYRFNNANEYITMISDQVCREYWRRAEGLDCRENPIPDFEP